jgi:transposase-like protein
MSPKREYTGEAIDATVTHLSELEEPGSDRNNGDESTITGEGTELQTKIAELDMLNPGIGVREIARELDADPSYVSEVLNRKHGGKYARYRKEKWSEYPETYKEIIKLYRSGICDSQAEIAERVGVSDVLVFKVVIANKHILDVES